MKNFLLNLEISKSFANKCYWVAANLMKLVLTFIVIALVASLVSCDERYYDSSQDLAAVYSKTKMSVDDIQELWNTDVPNATIPLEYFIRSKYNGPISPIKAPVTNPAWYKTRGSNTYSLIVVDAPQSIGTVYVDAFQVSSEMTYDYDASVWYIFLNEEPDRLDYRIYSPDFTVYDFFNADAGDILFYNRQ